MGNGELGIHKEKRYLYYSLEEDFRTIAFYYYMILDTPPNCSEYIFNVLNTTCFKMITIYYFINLLRWEKCFRTIAFCCYMIFR